ncbi:MAG TPA: TusE/DsrC/DsvC family sulfur relay protein [Candidatus Dormibacteraeota bacterium]|nr:TusE/DsrC/DsvC family sulfur relay protein [Candidatus Dormibacteraeota bacterium]HVB65886.1 TusE/DsrC/DsvC family sulfur relay protein [Nitrolancea sp.]
METLEILGKHLAVDKDGHLVNRADWSEELARAIAVQEGVGELTDLHWAVIRAMQMAFDRDGEAPSIRRLTHESGVDTKTLYQLFPKGPAKKAAKIAGLPKPKGCI